MSHDARRRLSALREEIVPLRSHPWSQIESWAVKASRIISRDWPHDLDDFNRVVAQPQWSSPPAIAWDGDDYRNWRDSAEASTHAENIAKAEQAKTKIVSFIDGLLAATEDENASKEQSPPVASDVRQKILQAILEIQGDSGKYVLDKAIADQLCLSLEEVQGHLEILRDENRIRFTSSNAGCSGHMTAGQKQRFNESQMLEQTRQFEIARVVAPVEITDSLDRFRRDHPDPNKVAFIMMRFGSTSAHDAIVEGIRSALSSLGIAGLRADDQQYHDDLWYNVLTYIVGCGFGISVFERLEQDEFNPNVSLEVGCMYGLNKPVCLLKDKTLRQLHSDLMGKLYRPFDPQDPKGTIPVELSKWLADKGIG
jgi:hypothetical protein